MAIYNNTNRFPAEWEKQSAVQLTWPHENTDWNYILDDAITNFRAIAEAVTMFEPLIIVCQDIDRTKKELGDKVDMSKVIFRKVPSNDTWARDHSGLSIFRDGHKLLADFTFNGWGMKYPANYDNLITRSLYALRTFANDVECDSLSLVLEGGGVESDGCGTVMTTESVMFSANRNEHYPMPELLRAVSASLCCDKVIVLHPFPLAGDDTDGHIDTLARFCNPHTITYVGLPDKDDINYESLKILEEELQGLVAKDGKKYKLVPLPSVPPIYDENGMRLPATYANFLIINGAVLVPTYNCETDAEALRIIKDLFPGRKVIGIDCRTLIRQHGSLHCVTMQYYDGFVEM